MTNYYIVIPMLTEKGAKAAQQDIRFFSRIISSEDHPEMDNIYFSDNPNHYANRKSDD